MHKTIFDKSQVQKIKQQIDDIKNILPEDYVSKFNGKTKAIDEFFLKRQKVCLGEFSTIVLSESGDFNKGSKKLSDEEREVCLRELKKLQGSYINNFFNVKKKYIDYLHRKRIEELEQARELELKKFR